MTAATIESIIAVMQAGNPTEAERLCGKYLQHQFDEPNVLLLLALCLQQQNKLNEAVEVYAKLTRLHPDNGMHWGNYATALRMAGDLNAAEEAAKEAVRLAPDDGSALEQLGLLQLQRGDVLAARGTLLKAFGKAPESPAIRIHAARACADCRDYRAEDLLRPWRQWLPLEDSLQYELGDLQVQIGEAIAAKELLEDLIQRAPSHWPAQLLLASVYERVNLVADAEMLLRRIIASGVSDTDPVIRLEVARQQAQLALRRKDLTTARVTFERLGPRNDADYAHYFALAGILDKQGDITAAMRALQVAHARQIAEMRRIAPHRFESSAPILPAAVARVTKEDYCSWPELKSPDAGQSPIFIVGFPRSGTTLLEQMLDAHPRLQSMDERPFFNILSNQLDDFGLHMPQDLGKLDQRDCDELRKGYLTLACSKVPRRWDAQLVDKNPLNMLWLPMIHRLFPEARFILAVRHPCDVILSCYMQNFRAAGLAVASESLERLAQAYVAAMECWLYHVDVIKPDNFISRYEDLVADTPGQIRRIAAFLDLGDAESMLNFDARARQKGYIATPSYTQVIEPINTRGLNRWHRYAEYFRSALPILQPMLDQWNYTAMPTNSSEC